MSWSVVVPPQPYSPGDSETCSLSSMSSQSDTPSVPLSPRPLRQRTLTQDPEYYFDDGNIIFQVEETLFRVHRHFFARDSPKFRDMLSILHPSGPSTSPDGTSNEKPLVLPQVSAADFKRLLWMFYNPTYTNHVASVEDWCAILSLADRWQMDTIGTVAIEELGKLPMDPIKKIMLGEKYGVNRQWALEAYVSLCTRERRLSREEGREVGVDLFTLIADAREQVIQRRWAEESQPIIVIPPTPIPWDERRKTSPPPQSSSPFEDIVMNTIIRPLTDPRTSGCCHPRPTVAVTPR